jgi:hypothetical protein
MELRHVLNLNHPFSCRGKFEDEKLRVSDFKTPLEFDLKRVIDFILFPLRPFADAEQQHSELIC